MEQQNIFPETQTSAWLDNLNPNQRKAVEYADGPLLVLAGAGSGKTRVITYRIAQLIQSRRVSPWNILAVTFTNRASQEMKERVTNLLGDRARPVSLSTFHSLCARILRAEALSLGLATDFTIYDDQDSQSVLKAAKEALPGEFDLKTQALRSQISRAKCEMMGPDDFEATIDKSDENALRIAKIYRFYEESLRQNQALDFDDLLLFAIKLFEEHKPILDKYQNRFRHILVDEYQDTNRAQYKLLRFLAGPDSHPDLCVVGDDDQSIYRWRGAQINNILDFEKDFPGTCIIRLEENYRSTQTILNAANAVVANNKQRKGKTLWTQNVTGNLLRLLTGNDEHEEASAVADTILQERKARGSGTGIAVFYRTNSQSRALEESLIRRRIPYQIIGGMRFYERQEIKDTLAYLRLILNPADNEAFKRAIGNPRRGVGATTIDRLIQWGQDRGYTLLEAARAIETESDVRSSQKTALIKFAADFAQWRKDLESDIPFSKLLENIMKQSGYRAMLELDLTERPRLENLDSLLVGARDFEKTYSSANDDESANASSVETARAYLERSALMSAPDAIAETSDCVTMMTLHCAKGLEFPVVFLTGLEEGILPHSRSLDHPPELEEERRLCYVGMTRARERLFLSFAWERKQRYGQGPRGVNTVSRFLKEVPEHFFDADCKDTYRLLSKPGHSFFDDRPNFDKGKRDYGNRDRSPLNPQSLRGTKTETSFDRGGARTESPSLSGPKTGYVPSVPKVPSAAPLSTGTKAEPLAVGDKIRHSMFGFGIVKAVKGSGDDLIATVRFDNGDTKMLMPKFAKLMRLK